MDLTKLPSTYYRVSLKALIFDDQNRLLVGYIQDDSPGWEIPGGGWEHNETIPQSLRRELQEEFGVGIKKIGSIRFVYRNKNSRGCPKVNLAFDVELESHDFNLGEMKQAKFVNKSELLGLDFGADEGKIKEYEQFIWPTRT